MLTVAQRIVLAVFGAGFLWCLKEIFFPGVPSFMKSLMPTEEQQTIRVGKNISRFHRHSFKKIPWDERLGPEMEMDPIPEHIDPFDPPRMRDKWLLRCSNGKCGAEKVVTRTSMV